MKDLKYLFYLTKVEGLGSVRIKRLTEKFMYAEDVFGASVKGLSLIENISEKTAESILRTSDRFPELEKEYSLLLKKAKKLNAGILGITDPDYPELLKKIYDPPVILYVKGNYNKRDLVNCVGIVGTRRPTDYGKKISEKFATELSSLGIAVISGFARGVDTNAHKAVLSNVEAKAVTAAVFGCGIDVVYPPENRKLYDQMCEKGILLSEYELSAIPDAVNFPKRNRIISGLSFGTIVIESDIDGGALITARTALDQSREVFAVPGYITSKSSGGTNALIKSGQAKLVENIEDVLEEIQNKLTGISTGINSVQKAEEKFIPELKGNEKIIYDVLCGQQEPLHIDAISELTGLNISDSLVSLLNMEFRNLAEQLPGKRFKTR
jgi:DNA processing protein